MKAKPELWRLTVQYGGEAVKGLCTEGRGRRSEVRRVVGRRLESFCVVGSGMWKAMNDRTQV